MQQDNKEDRRQFLRRSATIAWATPLLLTLPASRAGAQVSCAPGGTPCGVWNGSTCTGAGVLFCCEECNPIDFEEIGSPCQCA